MSTLAVQPARVLITKSRSHVLFDFKKLFIFVDSNLVSSHCLSTSSEHCSHADPSVDSAYRKPTMTIPPGTASHGNEIGGYIEFVDALRAAGATVEPGATVEQPFFEVSGQVIKVDGVDVQVFEFQNEDTRESVSSLITPEGQPNPTSIIDWVDQPNFWAKGRVIVLYVGKDQMVIDRLSQVLGDPITTPSISTCLATWRAQLQASKAQLAIQVPVYSTDSH
jgi:hypothetical protein